MLSNKDRYSVGITVDTVDIQDSEEWGFFLKGEGGGIPIVLPCMYVDCRVIRRERQNFEIRIAKECFTQYLALVNQCDLVNVSAVIRD